ncbi:MAG: alpha/beta hydrolase [Deltaproteobacteria bacterium]|jgi:predicted dienelactone hydrolase|nr:alpha/beta hydrolase [Deltaproteobacteria bacterium]MBW2535410.1 alpha/beta hydrolase [Deltaproteobacteria bacterium]
MRRRGTTGYLAVIVLSTMAVGACGEDDGDPFGATTTGSTTSEIDAGTGPDSGMLDSGPTEDAGPDAGAGRQAGMPLFAPGEVATFPTTIAGSDDSADLYHPNPPDLAQGDYLFPLAVLLQGANVGRQHYSGFAETVARYGFVVVVPDHESSTLMGTGLYSQNQVVPWVLDQLVVESQGAGPLAGKLDVGTMVLLGHSYGGVVGMYVLQNICQLPFCSGGFTRPAAVAGAAFYGTNMKGPLGGPIAPIHNEGLPVALVQGTVDGKASVADAQETFDQIQVPPKGLVTITGANHYGLCNSDNPAGAQADPNVPTIDQAVAQETAARWSAVYLRATVLGDPLDLEYLSTIGPGQDGNVTVVSTP